MNRVQGNNKSMTNDEVKLITDDLRRRGKRSVNTRMNDIIFRLATVCGLRSFEIAKLRICDLKLSLEKPRIHVHEGKGKKSGDVIIPCTCTAAHLATHLAERKSSGANATDRFLIKTNGKGFDRQEIAKRFKSAIRGLPTERANDITIHWGRHTAATRLLDDGKNIAQVQQFLRHSNIQTTSIYLWGRDIEPIAMYE